MKTAYIRIDGEEVRLRLETLDAHLIGECQQKNEMTLTLKDAEPVTDTLVTNGWNLRFEHDGPKIKINIEE